VFSIQSTGNNKIAFMGIGFCHFIAYAIPLNLAAETGTIDSLPGFPSHQQEIIAHCEASRRSFHFYPKSDVKPGCQELRNFPPKHCIGCHNSTLSL
jgi:hypothetical protein